MKNHCISCWNNF